MPVPTFSLAVKGADHPNKRGPGRRFEIAICKPGEAVLLIPEPINPVDPLAVMVVSSRNVQIGYVPAEKCAWIGGMIKNGVEVRAIFQEATAYGAAIRVTTDGSEPVLPPLRPTPPPESFADDDPGFFPDPEWPD